jgi:hypothetical protein
MFSPDDQWILFIVVCILVFFLSNRRVDLEENTSRYPNNHDHLKRPHNDRDSAEAEIRRMQRIGAHGSGRLNAYYNPDRGQWFVGKSSY